MNDKIKILLNKQKICELMGDSYKKYVNQLNK